MPCTGIVGSPVFPNESRSPQSGDGGRYAAKNTMMVADRSNGIVDLIGTVGTSLIIQYASGITYANQTGGTACLQSRAEGVLIPIENDYAADGAFLSLEIDLAKHFAVAWGTSGATSGIEESDADAIDSLLSTRKLSDWFSVDRERLNESYEAWIHVTVKSAHAFYCNGFTPYPKPGILTWANSD